MRSWAARRFSRTSALRSVPVTRPVFERQGRCWPRRSSAWIRAHHRNSSQSTSGARSTRSEKSPVRLIPRSCSERFSVNSVSGNENSNRRLRRFVFREDKSAVFKARGTKIDKESAGQLRNAQVDDLRVLVLADLAK